MSRLFNRATQVRSMIVLAAVGLALTFGSGASRGQLSASRSSSASPRGAHVLVANPSPLDPRIAALAKRDPSRLIETIVQFKADVTPLQARADTARAGGSVISELHIIHALAVKLSAAQACSLAATANVHSVSLNAPITPESEPGAPNPGQLATTFNQSLNSPALWKIGGTGAGVGVAVIDTGIAGDLRDFRSWAERRSRVIATVVTNPLAQTASDSYGHGTDVAGIIAGNGANRDSSDPLRGQYAGVAPDANLISIKVSDETGNATVLDVIYGVQFAVDHRFRYGIRVVNLSLTSTAAQSYLTDPLDAAVESAWLHGLVVVAAAGNQGTAADAVQYAPANDPYVITVGASDEHGTAAPAGHTIADWSSRGTTQDGIAKPDLYAPGAHIVSDLAPNSAFGTMCSSCIIGGQYIRASGTSMAAPMISGLVADLLQVHRRWTPDQLKGALTSLSVQSSSLPEVDSVKLANLTSPPPANRGLTPATLLIGDAARNGDDGGDGGDGDNGHNWSIDYTRSSWSRSSWSVATGSLSAGFARSSWSCTCSRSSTGQIDPTRSSWSTSSWAIGPFN